MKRREKARKRRESVTGKRTTREKREGEMWREKKEETERTEKISEWEVSNKKKQRGKKRWGKRRRGEQTKREKKKCEKEEIYIRRNERYYILEVGWKSDMQQSERKGRKSMNGKERMGRKVWEKERSKNRRMRNFHRI